MDTDNPQSPIPNPQSLISAPLCAGGGCCPGKATRRDFIRLAGAATASLATASAVSQEGHAADDSGKPDHFVPVEKNLDPNWIKALTERGERTIYSGNDLDTIAMPVGGLCAGQLYLTGDGRLAHWDICNQIVFLGYGQGSYALGRKPVSPIEQGFAVRVEAGEKSIVRTLDRKGFPGVQFCGEYPIGTVWYEDKDLPVSVELQAFSPFIPLNAADSALPATIMSFTVKNTSAAPVKVSLAGWMQNAVCIESGKEMSGVHVNRIVRLEYVSTKEPRTKGPIAGVLLAEAKGSADQQPPRPPLVLADFEGNDYGQWKVEGEAFGKGPAKGTLANQQPVSGFEGKGLVNSFLGGDGPTGKLTSPPFKIERRYVTFLIGGGRKPGKTCINLFVDGKVVLSATGRDNEKLLPHNWDVSQWMGKEAQIEIVDAASDGWGHINIDQIEQRDKPRSTRSGPLEAQSDFGTMALALLTADGAGAEELLARDVGNAKLPEGIFRDGRNWGGEQPEKPFGQPLIGGLRRTLTIEPGQSKKFTFVVAWHFPNRPDRGHYYATRFRDAAAVVQHIAEHYSQLSADTAAWHDTWYDSTLPHWLLDRLFSTVSILATSTCQWWKNGRFWAWEGVNCCHGTCAHVWNYEHSLARLFPQLERSVREMQDYGAGFVEETGMVRFRGEGWAMWAGDAQPGTVLKAYREHCMSPDGEFLKRLWPKVRKSLKFLFKQDGNEDGLLEGQQHNTYDIDFFGANTMVGSLYLAALRAGEEMANEMGDQEFAAKCRKIFESGSRLSVERLYNGEYFFQDVDLKKHPKWQYADGCLADQLFGQGWAHQVALGYVYPKEKVLSALKAIWKYDWVPDIAPQNKAHPPERWFARPGEAGLFICTWPRGKHLGPESVRYRDEVWTGIEYQVAGHMAWEGMLTEALAICRAVHERYHPAKHNPWNEVECGDHYSRAMASHGVFLALCGWEYHGPKGHLGFAPKLSPEDFRAAFTAAESWGTLVQKRDQQGQTNRIEVRRGSLSVKTLALELPEGATLKENKVVVAGKAVQSAAKQDGRRVTITLAAPTVVRAEPGRPEVERTIEVRLVV